MNRPNQRRSSATFSSALSDPRRTRKGCIAAMLHDILANWLFADPVIGFKDMPLTTTEWYCPGPGLVRVVRNEPANSTFLVGGTQTLELNEWQ